MVKLLKLTALALFLGNFAASYPALAGDKKDRDTMRDLGYILGREIKDDKDKDKDNDNVVYYRDKDKNRIYGTKKLYEGRDVVIYRGYDSKGRKYTITKRK